MRAKERIPIVLEFFKNNQTAYLKFIEQENLLYHDALVGDYKNKNCFWCDNPDWRFGQFLININLIPNSIIWFKEEQDWLVENGYFKFEDINFWGVNVDVNNKPLDQPYKKLLKDLDDDHIENIIEYYEQRNAKLNPRYEQYFRDRINNKQRSVSKGI